MRCSTLFLPPIQFAFSCTVRPFFSFTFSLPFAQLVHRTLYSIAIATTYFHVEAFFFSFSSSSPILCSLSSRELFFCLFALFSCAALRYPLLTSIAISIYVIYCVIMQTRQEIKWNFIRVYLSFAHMEHMKIAVSSECARARARTPCVWPQHTAISLTSVRLITYPSASCTRLILVAKVRCNRTSEGWTEEGS